MLEAKDEIVGECHGDVIGLSVRLKVQDQSVKIGK
jgi:hypothetical protein